MWSVARINGSKGWLKLTSHFTQGMRMPVASVMSYYKSKTGDVIRVGKHLTNKLMSGFISRITKYF